MLVRVPYPIGWFNNQISSLACARMGVREIKIRDWVPVNDIFRISLPKNFDLARYIEQDKLHAIQFEYEGKVDVVLHPDKLFNIANNSIRRKIRDTLH